MCDIFTIAPLNTWLCHVIYLKLSYNNIEVLNGLMWEPQGAVPQETNQIKQDVSVRTIRALQWFCCYSWSLKYWLLSFPSQISQTFIIIRSLSSNMNENLEECGRLTEDMWYSSLPCARNTDCSHSGVRACRKNRILHKNWLRWRLISLSNVTKLIEVAVLHMP